MRNHLLIALAVCAITLLSCRFFPGHTWLQQDTQIYVPILEHTYDPTVLANDPVAVHSHLTYSVYDELALAARRITGAPFHPILAADQFVFRAAAVFGVFLIGTALGLSTPLALLVAAVYALGASVMGPAVLTVEYEPKPRGSALGMLMLALGLIAHGRWRLAGVAGAAAFLYHPPTSIPFWMAYAVSLAPRDGRREKLRGAIPLLAAAVFLLLFSRFQAGGPEAQPWFSRLSPELERLQRFRAAYNWVSVWIGDWIGHYLTLWALSLAAILRLRSSIPRGLSYFLIGLPLAGLLSVPFAYLTYDISKWALMARLQPARTLVWVSAVAVVLAAAACWSAARRGRAAEAALWGIAAFAIPVSHNVWQLFWPDLSQPVVLRRVVLVLGLALGAALAGRLWEHNRRVAWVAGLALAVAPFFLLPSFGRVVTEKNMHHAELDELIGWARSSTDRDAVFLFADTGKGRQPGIFRAEALRAIYTDWKSGGQVNMVEEFAFEWWRRYDQTVNHPFRPEDLDRYPQLGIDYAVLQPGNRVGGREPVYANARYLVYKLR